MSTTTLNTADANRLVLEAFNSGWKNYMPKYQYIFTEMAPERKDERFSVTSSGGDIPQVAEGASFPQVNIQEAGIKTLSQIVFKESIPVTTLLQRFDNYGIVIEEAQKQGYRARLTMDRHCANVLNNSFTTETVWDGLSIYNAAHAIGTTGFTQSNLIAGDLTDTSLNDAQISLRSQKDHNNQELALLPRTLVVSPTFAKKAFELLESQGAPESANRNANFFNTMGMNIVVWELLSDPDAWFLFADKTFTRFRFLVAIPPRVEYIRRPETGNYEYQLEMAIKAGTPDYLGTVGSPGA